MILVAVPANDIYIYISTYDSARTRDVGTESLAARIFGYGKIKPVVIVDKLSVRPLKSRVIGLSPERYWRGPTSQEGRRGWWW